MSRYIYALSLMVGMVFPFLSPQAQAAHQGKNETTVAIFLFDGVEVIDFAGPYEIFGQANFNVFTVSQNGKKVQTAMGLSVNPDYSYKTMPEYDVLLVPGGNVRQVAEKKQTQQWVSQQAQSAQYVLSVCTGSDILAESGVLDGLTATSFHKHLGHFEQMYPKVKVVSDRRWVDNGKVITSAGLSSGLDASLHLVSKIKGLDFARTTALHLEYDWKPEGGFVRGLLADRFFPELEYQWPKKVNFEQLSSTGDLKHWQRKYKLTTEMAASEVIDVIGHSMGAIKQWGLVETNQSLTRVWHKPMPDGSKLILKVEADPNDQSSDQMNLLAQITLL